MSPPTPSKTPTAQAREKFIVAAVAAGHPLPRLAEPVHPPEAVLPSALLTFNRYGEPLIDGEEIFKAAVDLLDRIAPVYVEDQKTPEPSCRLLIADASDRDRLLAFTQQIVVEDEDDEAAWAAINLGRMVRSSRSLSLSRLIVVLTSEAGARHWCDPAAELRQVRQWTAALGLPGRSPEARMRALMEHLCQARSQEPARFTRLEFPSLSAEARFMRSACYSGLSASARSYHQAGNLNVQAEAALATDAGMLPITLAGARAHTSEQTSVLAACNLRVRIQGSCRLKESQQVLVLKASDPEAKPYRGTISARRLDPVDGSVSLSVDVSRTFALAEGREVLIMPAPFIRTGSKGEGAQRWDPRSQRQSPAPQHQIPLDVMIAGSSS